jgi:predicted DNA-binding transcriptional regulator AlpA
MPKANRESGDEKLAGLFDEFDGQLISPGGAAHLLGLSRKTVYTLCKKTELRAFRSDELGDPSTPAWVYIPLEDVYAYAQKVGRRIPGAERWLRKRQD